MIDGPKTPLAPGQKSPPRGTKRQRPKSVGAAAQLAGRSVRKLEDKSAQQVRYEELYEKVAMTASRWLSLGRSLKKTFTYVAKQRQAIARELDSKHAKHFGVFRTAGYKGYVFTRMGAWPRYQEQIIRNFPFCAGYRPRSSQIAMLGNHYTMDFASLEVCQLKADLAGEEVPLGLYVKAQQKTENANCFFYHKPQQSAFPAVSFFHTDKKYVGKILDHCERIYQKRWHCRGIEETVELAGELHWLLVHAMPVVRGTAACSEMIIKAFLLSKGIKFQGWCKRPDLEALATLDINTFKKAYQDLLIWA